MRIWTRPTIMAAGAILAGASGQAAVTTDGRVGPIQNLSGQMTIPQDLGTSTDFSPNLFHSFATFSIDAGESVTFTAIDPFDNVISRVTGGAASSIDGPLSSSITNSVGGGANLWLINPAGIVFGPGAALFVAGSFHASTADVLNLGNCATDPGTCGQFRATDPDASSLAVAAPESFGFLDSAPGPIEANQAFVQVNLGQSLSLTGGDISVTGGYWYAPGGSIRITSAAGPGVIPVDNLSAAATVTDFGDVSLSGVTVDTSGFPPQGPFPGFQAGRIFIRGGTVAADASTITSAHAGPAAGGGITLLGTEAIDVTNGTEVKIVNSGTGDPGTILLQGGDVNIGGGSAVNSQGATAGPGAPVIVSGADIRLDTGGKISAFGFQRSAGDITLTATGDLRIDGSGPAPATITSAVLFGTGGDAGTIVVNTGGTVSLVSGAQVSSQTNGAGLAGSLDVTAAGIVVDGTLTPDRLTAITSQTASGATGDAGAVTLTADTIRILGNGEVSSNTFSAGSAGSVTVNGETLIIDGTGGTASRFTGISSGSEAAATGNAGAIAVNTGSTTILGRGVISTNTSGTGDAGTVTLASSSLLLDGRSTPESFTGISSDSTASASGDAGAVDVTADTITILGGGHVSSTTAGTGAGGQVTLSGGTILIDGTGAPVGITDVASRSLPGAAANAGSVAVHGDSITLRGAASISTSTFNGGDAGQVLVSGDTILVDGLGAPAGITGIFSQSNGGVSGNAGSVTVQGDLIEIRDGGAIGSSTDGSGDAGNVTLSGEAGALATRVALTGAGSRINSLSAGAGTAAGRAGSIDITAARLALGDQAGILASTVDGAGGAVDVTADTLAIEGGARISAETTGSGTAGAIAIGGTGGSGTRTALVTVAGAGSGIVSSTAGTGDGGEVTVLASALEVTDGATIAAASTTVSDLRLGQAGSITVDVTDLAVRGGGEISTSTFNGGDAGQVLISGDTVLLDGLGAAAGLTGIFSQSNGGVSGNAGSVTVQADRIEVRDGAAIGSDTDGSGNAGDIRLSDAAEAPASQVILTGQGSRINSLSAGTGPDAGRAGSIRLTAARLALGDQAGILASTVDGAGGAVDIEADTLTIEGGAQVSAETAGSGTAGAIAIGGLGGPGSPAAVVTLAGAGSSIVSNTSGTGDGGEVTVLASALEVTDGATIAAASTTVGGLRAGPSAASSPRLGRAGSITIDVNDLAVLAGGTIGTTSATSGGGNIAILANGDVLLDHGAITASAQGVEAGDSGGNVSIARPRFLILDAGEIRADANAGRGGNITIDAVGFVASADSIVSASSAQSVDGQVTNTSENTVGTLLEVDVPDVVAADPIRTRCTDAQVQNRSSLVVRETRPGAVRSPWLVPDALAGAVIAQDLPCGPGLARF